MNHTGAAVGRAKNAFATTSYLIVDGAIVNHVGAANGPRRFTFFGFPETNQSLRRDWWSRGETRVGGLRRLVLTVINRGVAGAIGLFVGHVRDRGDGLRASSDESVEHVVQPDAHITPEELEILSPLIGALARMAAKQLAQEEADARQVGTVA